MEDKQTALKEESRDVSVPTPFPVPVENKEKGRDASGWLNILAYPVSLISGLLVWRTQVYEESHSSHDRKGAFEDFKTPSLKEYNGIVKDVTTTNSNIPTDEKRGKFRTNRKVFSENRDIKLKQMGFSNVFHHFGEISSHARNNALMSGFTIFWVSLGAMLMVANSKSVFGSKSEENKDSGISK